MPLAPKVLVQYGKADILSSESALEHLGYGEVGLSRLG